jgi:RNA polymerase sigma-70 factor (ECF subfamily)
LDVKRLHLFATPTRLDESVFETIFLEHYPRIFGILYRMVGDRDEADDLTAETFWKFWENPPSQNENIAGWLYRVATRLGLNAMRSAHRRASYEQRAGREALDHDHAPNPEDQAERLEASRRVRSTLNQMAARDVQILILRHSGLAYKEIAVALNLAPTSIGSLLARAEEKFSKLYQRGEENAPKR